MQIGHKGYSKAGGRIASGMTILAIIIAKLVVLGIIIARSGKNISIFNMKGSVLGSLQPHRPDYHRRGRRGRVPHRKRLKLKLNGQLVAA